MKTPQEKYESDQSYANLVDTIESLIHQAQFTPSEIREAAILACIHFEMKTIRTAIQILPEDWIELDKAFGAFERFRNSHENQT